MSKTYRVVIVDHLDEYITDYPGFESAMRAFWATVTQQNAIEATVWRVVDGKLAKRVAHCNNNEQA